MLQPFFVNPADFTRISLQLSICLSVYLQEEEEEEEVVVAVMSLSAKGGLLFIASSIGVLIRWVPAASFCCKGFCFSCFCCYMSPNQSAVLMLGASPPSLLLLCAAVAGLDFLHTHLSFSCSFGYPVTFLNG